MIFLGPAKGGIFRGRKDGGSCGEGKILRSGTIDKIAGNAKKKCPGIKGIFSSKLTVNVFEVGKKGGNNQNNNKIFGVFEIKTKSV